MAAGCRFYTYRIGAYYLKNTSTVAGFMMKACVIYLWKGKSVGMKNIHGAKPASVTGSCYSRWRPDAAFIHIELEHTISKYFYCGSSYDGSMCNMSLER